ncbi:MAG TPA: AAA family ATPase [Geminicoccus sp.]|uniref:AAA family ATPase n=1 Tax=Geminicoccus sp. TaxID=2024832 RepID=UPI002E35A555|nr:AAA family ATPase [Geminicoccus sp.]HEX2525859.1 AAA family ATPase [Geminicoccus sp.]
MRILAIRGQNLASLADRFAIEFEAEPIRTAGIFAIAGPTGAGKSTLLDAMCLALFDQLPRFDHADRGRIGQDDGNQQTYDDVRNVLRHGATEGFAEVDFTGQDGRTYRARWQVRRARGRSGGKIQDQKISLQDIETGQAIGGTKTETLGEIAKRIGLSFGQFRRAVLLAQGDFDTFIKADAKSRAELLERITGTGIYAELSRAAFARRKREEQEIAALEERLAGSRPLDPEAREAAVAAELQARRVLDEIERERDRIARAAAWHQTCQRLMQRLAEAEQAVAAARAAEQAEEPARAELALCERAFAVRSELDDLRRTEQAVVAGQKLLTEAKEAVERTAAWVDEATAARSAASERLFAVRQEMERTEPWLRRARALDTVIGQLDKEVAARLAELERRKAEHDDAQAAVGRAVQEHAAVAAERDVHAQWLHDHKALETFVPQVDEVVLDLEASAEVSRRLKEQQARADELAAARARLVAERALQVERSAELLFDLTDLEQRIAVRQVEAKAIDRAGTQQRLDIVRSVLSALENLDQTAREVRRAQAAITAAEREEERSATGLASALHELSRAEQERPSALARHDEARRSVGLSVAAAGEHAQHLRLLLVAGSPCPVCGATEHARTDVDSILAARADADRARLAELEQVLQRLDATIAGARGRIETLEQARPELASRRKLAADDLHQALRAAGCAANRARELGSAFDPDFPELPSDVAACDRDGLVQHVGRASAALAQAEADLGRLTSLETELRADRQRYEQVRQKKDAAEKAERDLAKRDQELDLERRLALAQLDLDRAELMRLRTRLHDRLEGPFPGWIDHAARDHRQFAEECRRVASDWSGRKVQIGRLEERLATCRIEMKEQEAALVLRASSRQEAGAAHAHKQRERTDAARDRAGVLEGRSVEEVDVDLRRRLKEAEEAQETANLALSTATDAQLVAQEAASAVERSLTSATLEQAESERKLTAALACRRVSREEAERAIARGEPWLVAERERLAVVRRVLEESLTTEAERRKSLAEHEQAGRPPEGPEDIDTLAAAVEQRRQVAEKVHREHWAVLDRDDRIGREQEKVVAEIRARREQADVWLRLSDLIGSADGTKFRRFAQNLTLTQLLHLANRHLLDLHPRYELQRAPGGDLVLQVVDRYMADEVRGVHSLSGGERFLISLALALGLASLSSSHGIRVESLFIDEGFGALDAQSLSMAVSVLERLQATGRRIGVISHVEELKERIAVKVEVTPRGGGRSSVAVTSS